MNEHITFISTLHHPCLIVASEGLEGMRGTGSE